MARTDRVLAEQVRYYRSRASEYDVTAYGDLAAVGWRINRLVAQMAPTGDVLEIACGTGLWTVAIARHAATVTALDAAPEMIEIARRRVASPNITFVVADVFRWSTTARFDTIFFSGWLSHVPTRHFDQFWAVLARLLGEHGRVLFVDEHVDQRGKETYTADDEIIQRTLNDGSAFRIVKNFIDPDDLATRLGQRGWQPRIRRDGADWILGEARPPHRQHTERVAAV